MAFSYTKLACVLLIAVAVAAPAVEAAVSCGSVDDSIAPCLSYLEGESSSPSSACCSGVKSLNSQAATTAARQATCQCLKSAASSIPNLNSDNVSSLPSKCGVNIGYSIGANVDCSKVM